MEKLNEQEMKEVAGGYPNIEDKENYRDLNSLLDFIICHRYMKKSELIELLKTTRYCEKYGEEQVLYILNEHFPKWTFKPE